MYGGASILLWAVSGASLWFIIVWFTHDHNFRWTKALLWFLAGRLIGILALVFLGTGGVDISDVTRAVIFLTVTAVVVFLFVSWEFGRLKPIVWLKIILAWLAVDSLATLLGIGVAARAY